MATSPICWCSETPYFDAIFQQFDRGDRIVQCDDLNKLFLAMGYSVTAFFIARVQEVLDQDETGRIDKMKLYDWFVEHIDEFDVFENVTKSESNACQPGSSTVQTESSHDLPTSISSTDWAPLRLQNETLETMKERKQAQNTVILLRNRLHYLRTEEVKTLQRVQALRRYAREIEGNLKYRGMVKELREQTQNRQKENEKAVLSKEIRKQSHVMVGTQRMASIEQVKSERVDNLQSIQANRKLVQKGREDRYKEQREQERKSLHKRLQARGQQEKLLVEKAKNRLASELIRKATAESEAEELCLEEARTIQSLKVSKELERVATENLEFVMQWTGNKDSSYSAQNWTPKLSSSDDFWS
uniref:Uncharacterized protein AlNc14C343G10824 n=1 Tax=Albugo laibachii Nc14 TaxID=890382 RepID=F0WX65_9STRA|nr:conserved hypothetical protein [Albugo laibachii Nc14]|eukprot:CCA26056.1 conserved hypothetical protein [Albugo laibachii Nc14]